MAGKVREWILLRAAPRGLALAIDGVARAGSVDGVWLLGGRPG